VDRQVLHERRQHKRYAIDWMAVLLTKDEHGKEVFHGRLHDVSLGGAGFHADANIHTVQRLILLLEAPLAFGRVTKHIAGVECSMRTPIYVPEQGKFRVGLHFVRFHGINKHLLADILINRERDFIRQAQRAVPNMH
jgi:c-di-GMP-binding flagellar brake protein YcgR